MKWEDLDVYYPLPKEALKPAFKEFTALVAAGMEAHGFKAKGRKLLRLSGDLVQVIHLDTRGSWMGTSKHYETEIALVPLCDKTQFLEKYELTGRKKIEEIVPKIKNHYRINQQYPLLADYIIRNLTAHVLPYFQTYATTKEVIAHQRDFKLGDLGHRNEALIVFAALKNEKYDVAKRLIDNALAVYKNQHETAWFKEWADYERLIAVRDVPALQQKCAEAERQVLEFLKLSPRH